MKNCHLPPIFSRVKLPVTHCSTVLYMPLTNCPLPSLFWRNNRRNPKGHSRIVFAYFEMSPCRSKGFISPKIMGEKNCRKLIESQSNKMHYGQRYVDRWPSHRCVLIECLILKPCLSIPSVQPFPLDFWMWLWWICAHSVIRALVRSGNDVKWEDLVYSRSSHPKGVQWDRGQGSVQ